MSIILYSSILTNINWQYWWASSVTWPIDIPLNSLNPCSLIKGVRVVELPYRQANMLLPQFFVNQTFPFEMVFSFPGKIRQHGTSSPPCTSGDRHLLSVTSYRMSPPWEKKCERRQLSSLRTWPITRLVQSLDTLMTAAAKRSWLLPMSFSICSCSPMMGCQVDLYTWWPQTADENVNSSWSVITSAGNWCAKVQRLHVSSREN